MIWASRNPVRSKAKRVIDVVGAVALLCAAFPALVITGALIWITMGRPVFFRQLRPGYRERPFTLIKFRTMDEALDSQGRPLPDRQRLNRFGSFLRRTSLDELPELWNVLRGELSLVGPRPLLLKYLPFFTEEERIRFTARPGITGWAQVNGRNEAPWDDRLRKDIWYVQNWSLLLDLRILWLTVMKTVICKQVVVDARSKMLNLDEERAHTKSESA
jgi:lipopolysaccharide/colanic/teichoic acid biosynthesis glycosyltransferase